MNVYNLIYLVTFVAKSWQSNNKHVKRRSALFNLVAENFRYEANVISSKSAKSLSHCSQLCLSNSQCNSLNYNFEMALCELLNLNPCKVAGAELSPEPGWTHFHAFSSDGVVRFFHILSINQLLKYLFFSIQYKIYTITHYLL